MTELAVTSKIEPPSPDWYKSNPAHCLHPTLHNMEDALEHSRRTGETVYMVYLREIYSSDDLGNILSLLIERQRAKVGKGQIVNGDIARDPNAGGSDSILNTLAVIPCADSIAYSVLEELFHEYLRSKGRWVEPIANDHGKFSGKEWFKQWPANKQEAITEFNNIAKLITANPNVGKTIFKPRYYQELAAQAIDAWWTNTVDSDFYLMLKPRAGKNLTSLLSLVYHAVNVDQRQEVLMLSQWPSAFAGMINDCKNTIFNGVNFQNKNVAYVNTQVKGWQEHLISARASNACAIVIMCSMQSIDSTVITGDDQYDETKTHDLLNLGIRTAIFDESDYGLRTANSQTICDAFAFDRRIWMSGTDLYAMRHLLKPGNHYCYSIINEIEDVIEKRIEPRPLIKKTAMKADEIPYINDIDVIDMCATGLSRRIKVLLKTNLDLDVDTDEDAVINTKYCLDPHSKLWKDDKGQVISFKKPSEVEALFDYTYEWSNSKAWKGPLDHDNIFWTMPSVNSIYAMHNLIRMRKNNANLNTNKINVKHEPLVANSYTNPSSIEHEVNLDIKHYGKTIFLTVGKMLRGAKAPWSAVVRWDDYLDVKIGLQIELRGQNTTDPEFYVYDFNIWRAESSNYELIRSTSQTGADIDSLGQRLYGLIPIMCKGTFKSIDVTWEDIVKAWQNDRISESFKSNKLINDLGVANNRDLLESVNTLDTNGKSKRDALAGKNGPKNKKSGTPSSGSNLDPLAELRKKALTISKNLPLLVYLTDGEYRELNTLFSNCSDEILSDWLSRVGIFVSDIDYVKEHLPKLFEAELMNHQLFIAAQRFKNGEFDDSDIADFARPKSGDVNVPDELVNKILDTIPAEFWNNLV